MGKPDGLTEDEYIDELWKYFKALDGTETEKAMRPLYATMWHMMEFLPEKLNDSIERLALEGRQKVVMDHQRKIGAEIPSPAKFAEEVAKFEKEAIKRRLPTLQPTKTKPAWKNEGNLKRFADKVLTRQLLCQCMKNIYDRCDFLEEWADDLMHDAQFKLLSREVPQEAIAWAIRQIGDDAVTARDKEPVPLACEISRQELDLPLQDIQTLNSYYLEGAKLLRNDRRKDKTLAKSALPSPLSTSPVDSGDSSLPTSKADSDDSR
jgi:hypothetical protein